LAGDGGGGNTVGLSVPDISDVAGVLCFCASAGDFALAAGVVLPFELVEVEVDMVGVRLRSGW
jgi:hypothetical protein